MTDLSLTRVSYSQRHLSTMASLNTHASWKRCRRIAAACRIQVKSWLTDTCRAAADRGLALLFITMTLPVWILSVVSLLVGRRPLTSNERVGEAGRTFRQLRFDTAQIVGGNFLRRLRVENLPVLLNVLRGDIGFVGPRALERCEITNADSRIRTRCLVRPGLICLWWLRRRANIAYGDEWAADVEYARQRSFFADIGILVRSIPAMLQRENNTVAGGNQLFGIRFDNVTLDQALGQIDRGLKRPGLDRVSFINADCINQTFRDDDYRAALQQCDHVYADGIGINIAGRILGCPIRENVNGTDLFPRLCARLAGQSTRVFLLGGRPGVADAVRDWIQNNHPEVTVCGTQHGYFDAAEESHILQRIDEAQTDLLLVAFGAPKQDVWIRDRLGNSNVRVAVGVGGLFDFFSGRIPRAPIWVRELGMEWAYRLYQEPARLWRRYVVGNVTFLRRTIVLRLSEQFRCSTGICE